MATKIGKTTNYFPHPFLLLLDLGSKIEKNQEPG
jgi:hypothetical protein